jgi:hypothetical protein
MDTATTRIGMMATQAIDVLIAAVEQTPPEMWDRPSNMEGWSLRDYLGRSVD